VCSSNSQSIFVEKLTQNGYTVKVIQRFYKGDQNLFWDALPYAYALLRIAPDASFFIQDEKLGTSDPRIKIDSRYQVTTDYCSAHAGAVWIHQDISEGPFFVPPIEPPAWKKLGIHLKKIDTSYEDIADSFGLWLHLEHMGIKRNPGFLIRSITESSNYIGIVPTQNTQRSISSIIVDDELKKKYFQLFVASYKGALAVNPEKKRDEVRKRARKIQAAFADFFKTNSNPTVSQLQEYVWKIGFSELFGKTAPRIRRASEIFTLASDEIRHIVLVTALSHPDEFIESYNESLNKAKLPLKRLKKTCDGWVELPFFLECMLDGNLVRFRIRVFFNEDSISINLIYPPTGFTLETKVPKKPSLQDIRGVFLPICGTQTLIGKAGPLLAEVTRPPSIIALPETGSKYSPMVYHLTRELQSRGVNFPNGTILRLGVHALDSLKQLGDTAVNLPPFLSCHWGGRKSAAWIADNWKSSALTATNLISSMNYHPMQVLNLARYVVLEKCNKLTCPLPPKLAKLGDVRGISAPLSFDATKKLEELLVQRDILLKERREKRAEFSKLDELYKVNKAIELMMIGLLKRHCQLASLFYVDRRPFALSFYLAWGRELIESMADMAHQRREPC